MNALERLRHWTMRLPNKWGLGQAEIHSSLFIMLGLLMLLVAGVGFTRPGLAELIPIAVTLPVVWVVSLAVRVAAQQLVLGESAVEMETTVGPTGNLSTDYEFLPPKRILIYALAGQLATLGLALLGFMISAAILHAGEATEITVAGLLDLKGGWRSEAWASQIMWVNIFLGALHLLPTVPFDSRAILFALFSLPLRTAQEPHVFRRMALLVSHCAMFMFGVGVSLLVMNFVLRHEVAGWYAAVAAAVYLFVAGRWESARADELEEQYAPVSHRHVSHGRIAKAPHLKFRIDGGQAVGGQSSQKSTEATLTPSEVAGLLQGDGEPSLLAATDIDDILRKLHREGRQSLSPGEQQALLSASRQIKERRGQTS